MTQHHHIMMHNFARHSMMSEYIDVAYAIHDNTDIWCRRMWWMDESVIMMRKISHTNLGKPTACGGSPSYDTRQLYAYLKSQRDGVFSWLCPGTLQHITTPLDRKCPLSRWETALWIVHRHELQSPRQVSNWKPSHRPVSQLSTTWGFFFPLYRSSVFWKVGGT